MKGKFVVSEDCYSVYSMTSRESFKEYATQEFEILNREEFELFKDFKDKLQNIRDIKELRKKAERADVLEASLQNIREAMGISATDKERK